MRSITFMAFLLVLSVVFNSPLPAEGAKKKNIKNTGTLKGLVKIDGKVKKVNSAKTKFSPYASLYKKSYDKADEKETVKKEPDHLLVYLESDKLRSSPTGNNPVLGQKDRQFSTDLLAVVGGSSVDVTNDDRVYHHIFSKKKPWKFDSKKKGPGKKDTVNFQKPEEGIGIVPVFCDIHSDMRAHVIVMPHKYFAKVSEIGGKYEINDIPPGTYILTAWHQNLKPKKVKVRIDAGKTTRMSLNMIGEK